MSRLYRIIWSDIAQAFVAVSEISGARGKRSLGKRVRAGRAALAAAALCSSGLALALPAGGSISLGQGSITQAGANTTISQNSAKLAINWSSFNVGANETVTFAQPDRNAIALNRVSGGASQIDGRINANGQVFILNPNGIVFGKSAQVNVGGLVASQLGLSDSNFSSGNYDFGTRVVNGNIQHYAFREDGVHHPVTNLGQITAGEGGYVVLLGEDVNNAGAINAPKGRAELWSAPRATVVIAGSSLGSVTPTRIGESTGNDVQNSGTVQADGGSVTLASNNNPAAQTTHLVLNSGVLRARTLQNVQGVISLVNWQDNTRLGGTLDASAPDGGDGGQINTFAKIVTAEWNTVVTTAAASGKTGLWTTTYGASTEQPASDRLLSSVLGHALNNSNVAFQGATTLGVPDDIVRSSSNTLDYGYYRAQIKVNPALDNRTCELGGTVCPLVNSADIAKVNGSVTTITQTSPKLVINWPSLRIEADQTLNFVQPNAQAIALNRVSGPWNTEIFGKVNANGQVFILNPNGVVIRPGAQVNVGSLVASTLALSDVDFSAGNFQFTDSGSKARALNYEASVTAADGGSIVLLANGVVNTGTMQANGGSVALVADHNVTLTNVGTADLQVQSDDNVFLPGSHVVNQGNITADAGHIAMLANVGASGVGQTPYTSLQLLGGTLRTRWLNGKSGTIDIRGNAASIFNFDGAIDASAHPGLWGGEVNTEIGSLTAGSRASVMTTSGKYGALGDWNLHILRDANAVLPAAAINASLTNVAVDVTAGDAIVADAMALKGGRLAIRALGDRRAFHDYRLQRRRLRHLP